MKFFQQLQSIAPGLQLTLSITEKDGVFTVATLPASFKDIQPLLVSGTAEEMDEGFVEAIRKPLSTVLGLVTNATEFVKQVAPVAPVVEPAPAKDEPKSTAQPAEPVPAQEEKKPVDPPVTKAPPRKRPTAAEKRAAIAAAAKEKESETTVQPAFEMGAQVVYASPGVLRGQVGTVHNNLEVDGKIVVAFPGGEAGGSAIAISDLEIYVPKDEEPTEVSQEPETTPTDTLPEDDKLNEVSHALESATSSDHLRTIRETYAEIIEGSPTLEAIYFRRCDELVAPGDEQTQPQPEQSEEEHAAPQVEESEDLPAPAEQDDTQSAADDFMKDLI